MKTFELSGVQLDWAVAKCEGVAVAYDRMNGWWETSDPRYAEPNDPEVFSPSTNWAQGGSIIERECIDLEWTGIPNANFFCTIQGEYEAHGTTPLIAAMRCYVASRLGDEVEIPDDLLEEEE